MNRLDQYIEPAERENTRRSYASAVRHFEVVNRPGAITCPHFYSNAGLQTSQPRNQFLSLNCS